MALIRIKEYKHKRKSVAHILATNPNMQGKELAKKCGVSVSFINTLKKDTDFWDIVEREFKNYISQDFLAMDMAMIREAKEGNVQAYRAVNEKFGKFVKKYQFEVKSPYELFTNQEKEIESTDYEEIKEPLPERNPKNDKPTIRAKEERAKLQKEIKKDKLKAENRKRAAIRRRAKAVGLKPLPKGKTPKTKRQEWINELEKLEQIEREKKLNTFTYTEAQKHAQNTPKKDE